MSKRYYRPPVRRKSRSMGRQSRTAPKSSFIFRVNICLGLTIAVVGIAKMNNDMSHKMCDYIKNAVSENISAADMENGKTKLTYLLGINRELVSLDEDVIQTIKNED